MRVMVGSADELVIRLDGDRYGDGTLTSMVTGSPLSSASFPHIFVNAIGLLSQIGGKYDASSRNVSR